MTFLEIQELLRKGHNDLVAAFNNLVSHVGARNADLESAFADALAAFEVEFNEKVTSITVPAAEYAALVTQFNQIVQQFNDMMSTAPTTESTDYTTV